MTFRSEQLALLTRSGWVRCASVTRAVAAAYTVEVMDTRSLMTRQIWGAESGTVLKGKVRFRLGRADRGTGSARVAPAIAIDG